MSNQVRTMAAVHRKLAGKFHLHFCSDRECRLVYECSCATPAVNGRCHLCRGQPRAIWIAARDPQECCLGNCTLVVDKQLLLKYDLAGPGPWFQCKTCARCHGWPCTIQQEEVAK